MFRLPSIGETNGSMNGQANSIVEDQKVEPKVQDIEDVIPDAAREKKIMERALDKTRLVSH